MYQIVLNPNVMVKFRNTVNYYINFSIKQTYKQDKKTETNAWNTICSIMDRLDSLVDYLNKKQLDTGMWKNCAFDFFEFIEQAGVLVECIDEAFKIYECTSQTHHNIFKSKKINSNVPIDKTIEELDNDYFQYIRSLSTIHPSKTNRHKIFQNAKFEVSPYVIWNNGVLSIDNSRADLIIVTYNNELSSSLINKAIIVSEIFNYIKFKYYSLNYLSKYIKKEYNKKISNYRKAKIKKANDFENYMDYLNNLKNEADLRNPDLVETIQQVIDIFDYKLSNELNNEKFKKFKNALKYGMHSIYRQLQNMDFNCISEFDCLIDELLLGKIYFDDKDYRYPLSKIVYLNENVSDKSIAFIMYKELIPVFKKYVSLETDDLYKLNPKELYVLSQIALYFHALKYPNIINSLIPNNNKYR